MLRFWQIVFWISPVLTLVVPSGHFVGPFFMAWAGLFYWRQARVNTPVLDPVLKTSWRWMLGGFGCLVVVGVGLALWHSNHMGHYEMYVPFILFPAIAWLARAGRWKAEPWLLLVALGALLAFSYATYQVFVLGAGRAAGATGAPISFGNTAIVLGAVAFVAGVMFPFEGTQARWKRIFVLVAGVAGAAASLLSGTKGGWISLLTIGVAVAILANSHLSAWRRVLTSATVVLSLLIAGMLVPSHIVKDRVASGLKGGWHWMQTGQVTEGSVSARLEIWCLSMLMIAEKPWFGHGSIGDRERWDELSQQIEVSPELAKLYKENIKFVSAENEFIGALRGGGVLGSVGLFMGYLGVWLAFWRWRNHPDAQVKTLSTIGMFLVPMYLEFGLTVAVFGINVFRSVYVALAVSLLALITVRLHHIRRPT
jgi:O-antigen ligase